MHSLDSEFRQLLTGATSWGFSRHLPDRWLIYVGLQCAIRDDMDRLMFDIRRSLQNGEGFEAITPRRDGVLRLAMTLSEREVL